jgi:hypothetical protein
VSAQLTHRESAKTGFVSPDDRTRRAGAPERSVLHRTIRVAAAIGAMIVLASACSTAAQQPSPPAPASPQPPNSRQLTIWLTGYSWQDNTPPGSSIVGEPVLHKEAGGQGTFADPLTVAVTGHEGRMDWQPGTKFYLPTVQRYVIVEDSGAAEEPAGTDTHLDMWIGGEDGTKQATDDCENQLTGKVPAQLNPPDNMPVMAGPIFANGKCNIPPQGDNMGTYRGNNSGGDDNSGGDSGDGGGHHGHHGHHSDGNDNGGDEDQDN